MNNALSLILKKKRLLWIMRGKRIGRYSINKAEMVKKLTTLRKGYNWLSIYKVKTWFLERDQQQTLSKFKLKRTNHGNKK